MAEALEIRPVRTRRDMNAFIRAAYRAQGDNPRWAPALDMEAHEFFDPKHSPFAKENEIECYVALRGGEPVGRIAAIVNRAHLAYRKDETGHFGFIEAIDDREVFSALIDEASRFLAARGLKHIMGPFSASINHEVGILVHGFDETHMVRTNYSPPYYARRLEELGFTKAMDLIAFETKTDSSIDEKLERIRSADARWKNRGDLKTYGLTYRTWFPSFKRLLGLFNDAWSENWGAIPISDAEVAYIAKLMLPVIKPAWIRIAEWQGEPVGIVAQNSQCQRGLRKAPRKAAAVRLGAADDTHPRHRHAQLAHPDRGQRQEMAQLAGRSHGDGTDDARILRDRAREQDRSSRNQLGARNQHPRRAEHRAFRRQGDPKIPRLRTPALASPGLRFEQLVPDAVKHLRQ